MPRLNQLSVKIHIIILLLALIPLVGFSLFSIQFNRNTLLQEIQRANHEVALIARKTAEQTISDIQSKVIIALNTSGFTDLDTMDQEWILQSLISSFPEVLSFSLLNEKGKEIIKLSKTAFFLAEDLSNYSDNPVFLAASKGKNYISPIQISDKGNPTMTLSIPLWSADRNSIQQVMMIEITLQSVLNYISSKKISNSGRIYILDKKARLIAHPDFSLVLVGSFFTTNPIYQSFKHRTLSDNIHFYNDFNQHPVIGIGVSSHILHWLIIIEQPLNEALMSIHTMRYNLIILLIVIVIITIGITFILTHWLVHPLQQLEQGAERITQGDLDHCIAVISNDEIGRVTHAFNQMIQSLKANRAKIQQQTLKIETDNWFKTGQAELSQVMRGDLSVEELGNNILRYLSHYLEANIATFFVREDNFYPDNQDTNNEENGCLKRISSYASIQIKEQQLNTQTQTIIPFGEGIVGQVALEKKSIIITELPDNYIKICSGLVEMPPRSLFLTPILFEKFVIGVIELGSYQVFTTQQKSFIDQVVESIGISLNSALSRSYMKKLLEKEN